MKSQSNQKPKLIELVNPRTGKYFVRFDVKVSQQQRDTNDVIIGSTYTYEEVWMFHKPTLDEIKTLVCEYYNNLCGAKILSDFVWNGHKVWLSVLNQLNYSAVYSRANAGDSIFPIKLKYGATEAPDYYTFENAADYKSFYEAMDNFRQQCLEDCWKSKDSVDWSDYEQLLK